MLCLPSTAWPSTRLFAVARLIVAATKKHPLSRTRQLSMSTLTWTAAGVLYIHVQGYVICRHCSLIHERTELLTLKLQVPFHITAQIS